MKTSMFERTWSGQQVLKHSQYFMAVEIQLNHLQAYHCVMRYLFLFVKKSSLPELCFLTPSVS